MTDSGGKLSTSLYEKRGDFVCHIVNFPFLSSNVPSGPSYGVFISKLIRYARCLGTMLLTDYDDKLQLHNAIYRLRFCSNSLIYILSLSNSHNNVASIQKNRGDKLHRVIVTLDIATSVCLINFCRKATQPYNLRIFEEIFWQMSRSHWEIPEATEGNGEWSFPRIIFIWHMEEL